MFWSLPDEPRSSRCLLTTLAPETALSSFTSSKLNRSKPSQRVGSDSSPSDLQFVLIEKVKLGLPSSVIPVVPMAVISISLMIPVKTFFGVHRSKTDLRHSSHQVSWATIARITRPMHA